MTLVVMAAGMGSRFGGLKQVEPVDSEGNFIIDYTIYDAIQTGFKKVVFIIKEENYELFKETVGKRIESKIAVEYVFQKNDELPTGYECPKERVKPWGTGHAILSTSEVVKENFVVVNADDFYGREAIRAIKEYGDKLNPNALDFGLVGYKAFNTLSNSGAVKRGIIDINNNKVENLVETSIEKNGEQLIATNIITGEEKLIENEALVSMNLFALTPKVFEYLKSGFEEFLDANLDNLNNCEFYITSFICNCIKNAGASMEVIATNATWLGITYLSDKDYVVNSLKKLKEDGIYPEELWK